MVRTGVRLIGKVKTRPRPDKWPVSDQKHDLDQRIAIHGRDFEVKSKHLHLREPTDTSDVQNSGLFLKPEVGGAGGGAGLSHKKEIHDKVTDLWISLALVSL